MSKVRAFTIVELLVVLILASMLLTATTLLYTNVSSYQRRLQTRISRINTFSRLEYYLLNDARMSKQVKLNGRSLKFEPLGITYRFYGNYTERLYQSQSEMFLIPGNIFNKAGRIEASMDLFGQTVIVPIKVNVSYSQMWESSSK